MALYRKYRPATFAEVVGQEHVTEPLSTALDTGRISHAYLFSGPRGCGKTSSARILARSLNCVEGPTSTPCGVCASCVALAPGGPGNLDVIELDAASHGGVDDTRELRDRAFYAPAESRYRVFIVDEAHMVTTAGFNALLKIVEEPPAHLIFVFATTEPDKVLPTIRSRTHHYPFRLLPPATMRGLLGRICDQEGVQVEEAVYPLVIRAGGGSPRDSLSVLDQLLAGAGSEGVTYPRAVSLLGVTDIALIDDAVEALATDDGAALFGVIDRVVESGHDPRRFATDLLERLRDLILLRAVPDATDRGLVSGPGDVLDRMRAQADAIGPATLTRYAELLHEGLGEMRGATAPRLLLEVIAARMLLPSATDTESAALQRLERIERRLAGAPLPPAAGNAAPGNPTAGNPTAADPGVAGSATPQHGAQPTAGPSAAQPNPGGSPRRRGAEALAAMRAEKSGTQASPAPGTRQPEPTPPSGAAPSGSATGGSTPATSAAGPSHGAAGKPAPTSTGAPANRAAAGNSAPTSSNSSPADTHDAPDASAAAKPEGGVTDAGGSAPDLDAIAQSGDPAAAPSAARLPSGTSAARPPELDPVTGGPSDLPRSAARPEVAAPQQQSPAEAAPSSPGGGVSQAGTGSTAGSAAASATTASAATQPATSPAAQPVSPASPGPAADFERARETLLMLVGYASARAVAEPQWTEKLTGWAARLHTLTPAATAEIQTVLTEDAAALRELLGSAARVVHGADPAAPSVPVTGGAAAPARSAGPATAASVDTPGAAAGSTGAPDASSGEAVAPTSPAHAARPAAAADSPATRSDADAREQASEGIGSAAAQRDADGAARSTSARAEGAAPQAVPASVIDAGLQDSAAVAGSTAGRGSSDGGAHGAAGEHGQPGDRSDANAAAQRRNTGVPEGDSAPELPNAPAVAGAAVDPSVGEDSTGGAPRGADGQRDRIGDRAAGPDATGQRRTAEVPGFVPGADAPDGVAGRSDASGTSGAARAGAVGTPGEGDTTSTATRMAGAGHPGEPATGREGAESPAVAAAQEHEAGDVRRGAGIGGATADAVPAEAATDTESGAGGDAFVAARAGEGASVVPESETASGAARPGRDGAVEAEIGRGAEVAGAAEPTVGSGVPDTAAGAGKSERAGAADGAAGADMLATVEGAWVEIKAKVREFGPALPALLAAAAVARVEGDVIVLAHQHAALAQRLSEAKNLEAVRSTVRAVLGREFEVRWEVGGAAPGGAGRSAGNTGRGAGAGGGQAAAKKAPPKFSRPSQAKSAAAGAAEPRTDTSGGWGAPPSSARDGDSSGGAPASPLDDDIPLPDGPDLPDDPGPSDYSPVGYDGVPPASTEEEEREMLADAAVPVPPGDRRDPDEMALELLRSELGASPLEA
ncbi:DNA polymerase III subunit gamma and tau [Nocardia otitidiscaviarum]|uniref:DNA polymerase III subunit gamma and tau n=1 Tax=Nocardia otitidiscaviarum TaxID=1823 RepID=UPI0020D17F17|nr:DNA polymerase III subunit gamma and tau [Nocardia otitidiscaviarum]